jgi:hypothetical protein
MLTTVSPTLPQIYAWDVDHLIEAAHHWDSTANRWDDVYGQVWQQSLGMDWEGQARDALVERTTDDKTTVTRKSDRLREAAQTARKGAGDISAVQRSVLYKVDDAHNAGFVVGEDLSVTDTRTSRNAAELAQRQAQARAFSAEIRSRAAQLVAADSEVGTKLTATAGDIGRLTFDEKPITYDGKPFHVSADPRNGTIQLVDWKLTPTPSPEPGRTADDLRKAIKDLPQGTRGDYLEVRSLDDLQRLWDWSSAKAPTFTPGTPYRGGKGTLRKLPDGTIVGLGPSDAHGPTMDVQYPNGDYARIHINAERGGVPEIPSVAEPRTPEAESRAPAEVPPVAEPHAPAAEGGTPAEAPPIRGGLPELPFGAAPDPYSPASGPHIVYGPDHHPHSPPLLGEDPDEVP